ncbi:N-acetyltransferase [Seohaeicola zhoushanensis]|uniref:N-acetyltransferase n=2 Tax=Seohaeicola zhoushanensis TaxID=1569283 RepID=A0A8J3MB02_9RHOB|nr:N-acetyltransferase [Seohaeicola zhoushanensis]
MQMNDFFAALDATWPAASYRQLGPVTLREGQGGGSRVSAATVEGAFTEADLAAAETAMREMGQRPIFQLRPGQDTLDTALAARGYAVLDPVNLYTCPIEQLTDIPLPRMTVLEIWEPLALMLEIWEAAGIGPARIAVMMRASGPKTGLLGRHKDKPAGCAYVAIHDGIAMLHALEVLPTQRRSGMGKWFMRAAGLWAQKHGAHTMALMCTKANQAANGLYSSLNMQVVGDYHYRQLREETHTP